MKPKKAFLIPTGDELASGLVLDTDSPMLMQQIIKQAPSCMVTRYPVTLDDAGSIAGRIREAASQNADLVILIGGSGSGHLHSEILGKDCTGESMDSALDTVTSTALYGKNGHMWSRLVCGRLDDTLVVNVPGPYTEAEAACAALLEHLDESLETINQAMAAAVKRCYGTD